MDYIIYDKTNSLLQEFDGKDCDHLQISLHKNSAHVETKGLLVLQEIGQWVISYCSCVSRDSLNQPANPCTSCQTNIHILLENMLGVTRD